MLATSRDRTKDLFLEDVVNFLINSDISVNTNVKYTGQSGNNGKNVNGPDKNCPVLPNAYGCHLNSRIIRSFISV